MSSTRFEALCAALCEIAGVAMPAIAPDANGVIAFTFTHGGAETSVMQVPAFGESIIVAARLGNVADEAQDLRAARILMEANFLALGRSASPCVGRDPAGGDYVFHYTRNLGDTSAADLYQAILRMNELRREWHRTLNAAGIASA